MEALALGSFCHVPSEIVLQLADHLDQPSLQSFMKANKWFDALYRSYETSICKTRIAMLPTPTPTTNILSSDTVERRRLCGQNTFQQVEELERRAKRIDRLFEEAPKYFRIEAPGWLPPLSEEQHARFTDVLKRALWQCDMIADVAANEPCKLIPADAYTDTLSGVYSKRPLTWGQRARDPFANVGARPRQIEYIRSLPLDDIVGISLLVNMLGFDFARAREASASSDPAIFERITVFQECVLRHGTWFTWGHVMEEGALHKMTQEMARAGMHELTEWELGSIGVLEGLKMTLTAHYKELVAEEGDEDDDDGDIDRDRMQKAVNRLIFGTDDDDEDD
ncbi:hypothetical protein GGR57DRAFT_433977 [Xylariaceae sp. FL1272]|nr:hypothetical protein GGR57DRAFT_433977 [Xylariaceae sp. FL1272]